MGYNTHFTGKIEVVFKNEAEKLEAMELINGLASTRRMLRDLFHVKDDLPKDFKEYGVSGEFFYPDESWPWWECCGQGEDPSVIDYNTPPINQPGLWLQWIIEDDEGLKANIVWDENEKFYNYFEWMEYILQIIIKFNGNANGSISYIGDDHHDRGYIKVENSKVKNSKLKGK